MWHAVVIPLLGKQRNTNPWSLLASPMSSSTESDHVSKPVFEEQHLRLTSDLQMHRMHTHTPPRSHTHLHLHKHTHANTHKHSFSNFFFKLLVCFNCQRLIMVKGKKKMVEGKNLDSGAKVKFDSWFWPLLSVVLGTMSTSGISFASLTDLCS